MFFLYLFIYHFLVYKVYKKNLSYDDVIIIIQNIYLSCRKFIGWDTFINNTSQKIIQNTKHLDRILVISNHVSIVDFFHFIYVYKTLLPEHNIHLVAKGAFNNYPIIHEFMNKLCIPVYGSYEEDKNTIINFSQKIINSSEKTIVILFPEGKIFNKFNIDRSYKWSKRNLIQTTIQKHKYTNVVCPHSKGLYLLLKYFQPQTTLLNIIIFPDDIREKKGKEFYDYVTNYLPQYANIITRKCNINNVFDSIIKTTNNNELFTNDNQIQDANFTNYIYSLWDEIDNIIHIEKYRIYKNI